MAAASARAVERSLISKADGREADSGLGVGGDGLEGGGPLPAHTSTQAQGERPRPGAVLRFR